jgi:hypothetical protein
MQDVRRRREVPACRQALETRGPVTIDIDKHMPDRGNGVPRARTASRLNRVDADVDVPEGGITRAQPALKWLGHDHGERSHTLQRATSFVGFQKYGEPVVVLIGCFQEAADQIGVHEQTPSRCSYRFLLRLR